MNIKIKNPKKEDLDAFVDLAAERDKGADKAHGKLYWKKEFDTLLRGKRLFLAFEDKKLVGFLYFSNFFHTPDFYVEMVYVKKDMRKKGIAKELFKKIGELAKKKKVKLFSSTDYDNIPSLKMHKQMGFKNIGYIKGMGHPKNKEIFFCK